MPIFLKLNPRTNTAVVPALSRDPYAEAHHFKRCCSRLLLQHAAVVMPAQGRDDERDDAFENQGMPEAIKAQRSPVPWSSGGVLRLRWVRTMPSMMVMPIPGRSPSWTLSRMFLPAECCARSMMTKPAAIVLDNAAVERRPHPRCCRWQSRTRFPRGHRRRATTAATPCAKCPEGCTPSRAGHRYREWIRLRIAHLLTRDPQRIKRGALAAVVGEPVQGCALAALADTADLTVGQGGSRH